MAKQKDFNFFLSNIEPSKSTVKYISSVQSTLRKYLRDHDSYGDIFWDSFLSGSYAKHTSVRPKKGDGKRDVDIIIVTKHTQNDNSADVLTELYDVLIGSSTYKESVIQHHSIGIELGQISIDVVPVISDDNDGDLYYVADYESGEWILTDPKGHKIWSSEVNATNNYEYKPLVKIFKWWRKENCPSSKKYPKGITLERIIADNLGDSEASTEDFLIETMENIVSAYKNDYTDKGLLPVIDDPSDKINNNDLMEGYRVEDFKAFVENIDDHLRLLNDEGTENATWRKVLGYEFPQSKDQKSRLNYLLCERANHRQKMKWPFARDGAAFIKLRVEDKNGNVIPYENNGEPLEKGCTLYFSAYSSIKKTHHVMWQITNTGEEARIANCMRGDFYSSNNGSNGRIENTQYTGCHSVQCFIIRNGVCLAKSKDYIVNIK